MVLVVGWFEHVKRPLYIRGGEIDGIALKLNLITGGRGGGREKVEN